MENDVKVGDLVYDTHEGCSQVDRVWRHVTENGLDYWDVVAGGREMKVKRERDGNLWRVLSIEWDYSDL